MQLDWPDHRAFLWSGMVKNGCKPCPNGPKPCPNDLEARKASLQPNLETSPPCAGGFKETPKVH